jgi:hypothetical protein
MLTGALIEAATTSLTIHPGLCTSTHPLNRAAGGVSLIACWHLRALIWSRIRQSGTLQRRKNTSAIGFRDVRHLTGEAHADEAFGEKI